MSSSMRNAIQRRNHKERAQPASRSRLGLLEKHSDYALRAADHRDKKKRIKILRSKARDRNPDEFNFGMMRARQGADGMRIGDRGNVAMRQETVRLLKTQDEGYLRTVLNQTRREVQKKSSSLKVGEDGIDVLGNGGARRSKKLVFVETLDEQNLQRPAQLLRDSGEDEVDLEDESEVEQSSATTRPTYRDKAARKLKALQAREKELTTAQRELDLQRAKMSNSIGGINKNGVKFKIRERKR